MTEFFNGIKPFALEEVEIAPAVSSVFAVKNEEEKERSVARETLVVV